ncbi:MAG: FMN-binding protein [Bacteroidales bacterium]|nr:FMN-binding protein [Bacteroidales bacterium]
MMNSMKKTLGALLAAGVLALCSCGPQLPELPVENVKPYFAEAAKTKAIDTAFYEVKDAKGTKLGSVLYSSPYSDNVKGFNGPTPILIIMDAEDRIQNVVLLDNQETPFYAQRVADGGLYSAWNGLTAEEALRKEVDAVSGATYTSNGVKNSLVARLKAYRKQVK